jgi:hypothetical protein
VDNKNHYYGEVAEWLNAAVLKTAVGLVSTVSSNLTLSAIVDAKVNFAIGSLFTFRKIGSIFVMKDV